MGLGTVRIFITCGNLYRGITGLHGFSCLICMRPQKLIFFFFHITTHYMLGCCGVGQSSVNSRLPSSTREPSVIEINDEDSRDSIDETPEEKLSKSLV